MITFRKVRTLLPWSKTKTPWFAVSFGEHRIGFVYRQAPGRWAGELEHGRVRDNALVVSHTRETAAEALMWHAQAAKEGTGEPVGD